MPYVKVGFLNDGPPSINADNLNHMEQGIYDATENNAVLNDSINDLDRRTNQILSYVNYGYDEPIDYPLGDGSVWHKSIGIFRNGTTIVVNKSVTTSVSIRAKLTGEFELAGNNSGVDAWTTGISFKTGHQYKLVARLISGTANYSSNIVSVYRTGEHSSVGIATIKDGVFERLFTAEANINYNVAFLAEAKATFSNAKFLLTIEDLTESQFVDLQEQIDEVKLVSESANYSLKSGNITPSGSAGSNNKYIRTYKNNMPKIEKGDILIAKGGFAISNIHIFSANTVASIVHITGLTFTDENRFEVPEEYVGKYLGYTVYEPAKSGQDISADVEDAIRNVSVLHTTPISEVIADLKSQVDAIETDSISLPDYYFVDGYIDEKCNDINEIGVNIGRNSLRTVFFTDYHLEDNAKQTPNLINYLVEKTGIKNVVFGGDGFNHDYSSKVGGYDMICEFLNEFKKVNEIANMYLITGNHEMNNADLEHDSVELSKAVPGNLFNNPIFYKIKTLWETGKDTNTFYVDDDVNKMRIYGIDCTSGASIQKSYLDVILPSFLTVPEGYAVIIFSHTGVKNYTKDETVDPPVYTVTELNPAFDAIMQTGKAMNDGANATITTTIGGNTYTWNLDFTGNRRIFVGAVVGHVHFDSFYIYDDRFPVVVEICDTGAYRNSHPHRVAGTITEQAFDVIQVDIAEKKIYCTRIGYGSDRTFDFEYFLPVNNKEPYVYRQIPVANAESERLKKLVGGTVVWNQMVQETGKTNNGVTSSFSNGEWSLSGEIDNTFASVLQSIDVIQNHCYICLSTITANPNNLSFELLPLQMNWGSGKKIKKADSTRTSFFGIMNATNGSDFTGVKFKIIFVDLTAMFNSTIVDYVLSLETATAGSGIAWLKKYGYFTKDYYAYSANTMQSVSVSKHITKDSESQTLTETTLDHTTLRGLFKLDANNNLYADGDIYNADGSGSVKYGIVDLGTINWTTIDGTNHKAYVAFHLAKKPSSNSEVINAICSKYPVISRASEGYNPEWTVEGIGIDIGGSLFIGYPNNSWNTLSEIQTALSGVYLVYELATPTTALLTPFNPLSTIEQGGMEEFVDYGVSQGTRDVAIPVGNDTDFYIP